MSYRLAAPSRITWRPSRRLLRSLALLLAAVACTADAVAPTAAQVTGTYTLESISGEALPAQIFGSSTSIYVLQATRTLRSDGTCVTTGVLRSTYLGRESTGEFTAGCTWTLAGTALTFVMTEPVPFPLLGQETATVTRDGGSFSEATLPNSATNYYPHVWRKR